MAPPKRKKGAAAAARAAAASANAANPVSAHRMLPLLSLPDRQRLAQDLLAAPATHALVPNSPELGPAAAAAGGAIPAGPLLFMSSVSSLEDEAAWLPPARAGGAGCSPSISCVPSSSLSGVRLPAATVFSMGPAPRRTQQQQHHGPSLVAEELLLEKVEDGEGPPSFCGRNGQEDVIDLSANRQDRDPFEGVELWLEGGGGRDGRGDGGGEGAVTVSAGGLTEMGVPPMTFPSVAGDGSEVEQVCM